MLTSLLPGSLFDPERRVSFRIDQAQEVDTVTGCFFLLRAELWRDLGGFDPRYFMYAEEVDLCLRAAKRGYRLMVTPDAQIIHHGGASVTSSAVKQQQIFRGRSTIVRDHFGAWRSWLGLGLLWFTALNRYLGYSLLQALGRPVNDKAEMWKANWHGRKGWIRGY
jgi:GT2 family glycosyltransferase